MRKARSWLVVVTALALTLVAPAPTHAATTLSPSELKTRLIYFENAGRTVDAGLTLNALSARSAFTGKLWRTFLASWNTATTSQVLNYTTPTGLPTKGHVFVVLGGSLTAQGVLKQQTINRLNLALKASKAYPASKVLVSGGAPRNGVTEAAAMKKWLLAKGVASSRILTESRSTSTVGNAYRSIDVFAAHPSITSYTLVSDASHLRRAGVLFDAAVMQQQEETGKAWGIRRIANVAYRDKKIVNPATSATTTVIAQEVAMLLGLDDYSDLVDDPPARPVLSKLTVSPPRVTSYPVGAKLDEAGLKAVATFAKNAGSLDVTGAVKLSGFNTSKVGAPRVTAAFTSNGVTKSGSFTVTVKKATAKLGLKLSTRTVKRYSTRLKVTATPVASTGIGVSGKVAFYLRGKLRATVTLVKGRAAFTYPELIYTGRRTIEVKYLGSTTVTPATASAKITVTT